MTFGSSWPRRMRPGARARSSSSVVRGAVAGGGRGRAAPAWPPGSPSEAAARRRDRARSCCRTLTHLLDRPGGGDRGYRRPSCRPWRGCGAPRSRPWRSMSASPSLRAAVATHGALQLAQDHDVADGDGKQLEPEGRGLRGALLVQAAGRSRHVGERLLDRPPADRLAQRELQDEVQRPPGILVGGDGGDRVAHDIPRRQADLDRDAVGVGTSWPSTSSQVGRPSSTRMSVVSRR